MVKYLIEIRQRLLMVLVFFLLCFIACFIGSHYLLDFVVQPLLPVLGSQHTLIATKITTPIIAPLNLAADGALLLSVPMVLWQIWRFITPALHRQERFQFGQLLISSCILFCLGALFCFYLVLPCMLAFFAHALPAKVQYLPDLNDTIDFITRMTLIFGFCFQVPLICTILVQFKVIKATDLIAVRPYVIVAAFTLGMLLTPPDVLSQVMLAIPLWALYEVGIWATKRLP